MSTRLAFVLADVGLHCEFAEGLALAAQSFAEVDASTYESDCRAVVRLDVRHGAETSPASRGLALTSVFGETKGYSAPGRHELWDGDTLVVAELDGSGTRALVGPGSNQHRVGAVMLFAATALVLRAHRLFHMHAACVDMPGIGLVVIAGESGSGKTTLSLALASLNGRLISDDAIFIWEGEGGAVSVSGWPQGLHVARRTLEVFPHLAREAVRSVEDGRDKWVVPVAALGRPRLPEAVDPKLVLFPRVGTERSSRLTALSPARTVAQLVPHAGFWVIPGAPHSEAQLALLATLASRAKGFDITLGADALGGSSALLDLIQRAARGHAV